MKVRGCCRTMHVSIHAHSEVCEISAVSGVLHVLVTFLCFVLHFLLERSEWQRTRVGNVLCVSEATQGRFFYGLA